MSEDEFWGLTWREFDALSEQYRKEQDWANYRAALICAVFANMWRDSRTKPFTPDDFMPTKESKHQTPEQMLVTIKILNAAFGGNIQEN